MGRREWLDAHRPDFSFLPFHCRRVNGAVVWDAAGPRRFAARAVEACDTTERADPADRLVHPSSARFQFFAYALSRSAATDRSSLSVRRGDYAVDGATRTDRVDHRTARRLLPFYAVYSGARIRSARMHAPPFHPDPMGSSEPHFLHLL